MNFFKTSLGNDLNELKKFETLDISDRQIVFYSENRNSYTIFETLINELVETYDKSICYVTSDKDDNFLSGQNKKIKTFFIGDGVARTKFFLNLNAKILIMTMPDLGSFHIKRSKTSSVHYVYLFHSMISTHLGYRKEAFDNFDSIFCIGDYQINELKSAEKIYELKPKNLVPYGYGHLDNLIKNFSNKKPISKNHKQILIAPSWGKEGLSERYSEEIISSLLSSDYKVIFRPHPMSFKKFRKYISKIQKKFLSNSNFIFEKEIVSFNSFLESDLIISDWSGSALEFAFGFEKPVLYVDVPKKINNPDYLDIPFTPIEENIRSKIGVVVSIDELNNISDIIEDLLVKTDFYKKQISQIKKELIFNLGESHKIGGKEIIKILKNL